MPTVSLNVLVFRKPIPFSKTFYLPVYAGDMEIELFSLCLLAMLVLTPLTINAIFDLFTGYLYRPLSNCALLLAICGSLFLCYCGLLPLWQIITAIGMCLLIFSILFCTQRFLSWIRQNSGARKKTFLGKGDYRLLLSTSYLCALKDPSLALIALFLAAVFMLFLFALIALSQNISPKFTQFFQKNLQLLRGVFQKITAPARTPISRVTSVPLYQRQQAPMGFAIVLAAVVTLFGSIAQSTAIHGTIIT